MRALAGEYALHLLEWAWQASLVAAVALILVRWLPRASARFRGAALGLAIAKFCLPPMLPAPTGGFSRLGIMGGLQGPTLSMPALLAIGALALLHSAGMVGRWRGLWRAVVVCRRLQGRWKHHGRLRLLLAEPDRDLAAPFAYGWRRPTIVFPAEAWRRTTWEERRAVLAHERAHLKRFHGLLVPVEEFFAAVGWMNPLFRVAIEASRRVREELCDADALRSLRGDRVRYARSLVRVASLCGEADIRGSALSPLGTSVTIANRIRGLGARSRWSLPELAAALLLWLVLLPGVQPRVFAARGHTPAAHVVQQP
jgi:hypothetical protein